MLSTTVTGRHAGGILLAAVFRRSVVYACKLLCVDLCVSRDARFENNVGAIIQLLFGFVRIPDLASCRKLKICVRKVSIGRVGFSGKHFGGAGLIAG